MNPKVQSATTIIDFFNFQEPFRTQLLENHLTENFETEVELFSFISKVGEEGNKTGIAEELVFDMEERINIVKHKLKFIDESVKPSVLVLSDVIPPVVETSRYLTYLLRMAGAKPYDAQVGENSDFNPEVILLVSPQMEKMFGGLASLLMLEEWQQTNAVKNNRIFMVDGENNLQGMGINLASDVELLGEILYPQYLTFSGKGESWLPFEM